VLGAFLTLERVNLNVPRPPEFDTPLIVADKVFPVAEQEILENPLSGVHPVLEIVNSDGKVIYNLSSSNKGTLSVIKVI
jgi:hypothetical protein